MPTACSTSASVSTNSFPVRCASSRPTVVLPEDGDTPFIGTNGNWWISSTDTGVIADLLTHSICNHFCANRGKSTANCAGNCINGYQPPINRLTLLQNDGGEDRLFVITQSIRSASECLPCCTRQRPVVFALNMFPGHYIFISIFCVSCIGDSMG